MQATIPKFGQKLDITYVLETNRHLWYFNLTDNHITGPDTSYCMKVCLERGYGNNIAIFLPIHKY